MQIQTQNSITDPGTAFRAGQTKMIFLNVDAWLGRQTAMTLKSATMLQTVEPTLKLHLKATSASSLRLHDEILGDFIISEVKWPAPATALRTLLTATTFSLPWSN